MWGPAPMQQSFLGHIWYHRASNLPRSQAKSNLLLLLPNIFRLPMCCLGTLRQDHQILDQRVIVTWAAKFFSFHTLLLKLFWIGNGSWLNFPVTYLSKSTEWLTHRTLKTLM